VQPTSVDGTCVVVRVAYDRGLPCGVSRLVTDRKKRAGGNEGANHVGKVTTGASKKVIEIFDTHTHKESMVRQG